MTRYAAPGTDGALMSYAPRYDHWIGGAYVAPVLGRYFENPSPVDGRPFTEIARGSAEDVELALDAAHAAAPAWGRTAPAERAAVLLRIADRMESTPHDAGPLPADEERPPELLAEEARLLPGARKEASDLGICPAGASLSFPAQCTGGRRCTQEPEPRLWAQAPFRAAVARRRVLIRMPAAAPPRSNAPRVSGTSLPSPSAPSPAPAAQPNPASTAPTGWPEI